jgi:hypothetical protein
MYLRHALIGMLVLVLAGSARAQTAPSSADRLDQFEKRLADMESRHQADLQTRDQEIARLRAEVEELRQGRPPSTEPAGPESATTTPAASAPAATRPDEISRIAQDVLKDIGTHESKPPTLRIPASFNPDFAVIGDFRGNVSTNNSNPARGRFDLGSVELDLRAAVDPRADAVVILPVVREVEDPLFFSFDDATGEVETAVELEEAYLFLHDFGVPNLTAKLGRYHLRFGRWNQLHVHNWPTVDNAFAVQSFLGPESLNDAGLSLSYVIPPNLVGNNYLEVIAELISGEGGGEAPVLNNSAFVDSPALNTHLLWNHDIAPEWNLELGGSWLTGKHNDDNRQNVNLFGADFTLIHTDPTGRFNNQLFQGELFYGDVDNSREATQYAKGAYLLAQQQLDRDWYLGCRLDWSQNALNDREEIWGASPYVSWYLSEFLRLRLEYQYRGGDASDENILWFQANFVFGAHPPHPYWAMR